MKTLILILSKISLTKETRDRNVRVKKLKSEIIAYVGQRMLDGETEEEIPGIFLKNTLDEDEKDHLSKMCSDEDALIFVDHNEENVCRDKDYLECELLA